MRERVYSDGMMNIQTRVFNFQCFSSCYSITPFWNFWGPQNRHGIFLGSIFGPGIFWGFLEALGIFLGLDFWFHLIIPVTWNPEYPPPPPVLHPLKTPLLKLPVDRVPRRIFGICPIWSSGFGIVKQNRVEIRDWKNARDVGCQIKGLSEIWGRDYEIKEPFWGSSINSNNLSFFVTGSLVTILWTVTMQLPTPWNTFWEKPCN